MDNSGRMDGERPRTPPPSYSSSIDPPTYDFLVIPIPPITADNSERSSQAVDVPVFAVSYNRENRPEPLPLTGGQSWLDRSRYNVPPEKKICGFNRQCCYAILVTVLPTLFVGIVLYTTLRLVLY